MQSVQAPKPKTPSRSRDARLGFRVDEKTKRLIEYAAELERRSLTDYCLSVLAEASRERIEKQRRLELSEKDREAFFDALVNPPEIDDRLRRAFATAEQLLAR